MHQLVPDFILQQDTPSGEVVAITLFVDTFGFTPLTQTLMQHGTEGAECLADALNAVFTPLVAAVYAQGGFIAGFAGDAFKAIFPIVNQADTLHEALTAAWAMHDYLDKHPQLQTAYGVFNFSMKAALAHGTVRWEVWDSGMTVAKQRAVYLFSGEALDTAISAEQFAKAGDIIVTDALWQHVRPSVATGTFRETHWATTSVQTRPARTHKKQHGGNPDQAARFYDTRLLHTTLRGEFRPIVTTFINIATSDNAYINTLFRLLDQYNGYLCRIGRIGSRDAGTTLLLFWGAPVTHENDASLALRFLTEFRAAYPDLAWRAGVTSGIAYAGFIGSAEREEYTCHGPQVNLAARQMVSAPYGTIWVDGEIARQAGDQFQLSPIGNKQFKGFDTAQPVFELNARRDETSVTTFYGEMIGRERELVQLQALVRPIFEHQCGDVVAISGEAGIGKSRLLAEFIPTLLPRAQAIICQCDEHLQHPLHPFRYWLRRYFQQSSQCGDDENKRRFDTTLDALIAATPDPALQNGLRHKRSILGALLNLFWSNSLYARLDPKLRFENTLDVLKLLIKATCAQRPLLIVLEDAHWIDSDSLTFLQQLGRNVATVPFIVLTTTRDTARLVGANIPLQEIALNVLTAADIERLSTIHLAQRPAPALVDLLCRRSDGNPFFAEQLLLYWHDSNSLQQTEAGLMLRTTEQNLTQDIRSVLLARLDRLTQRVRSVVQTAAVLGREFEVQLLSHMLHTSETVRNDVDSAEQAAIWHAVSQLRYLFQHALLRDAAYEMQLNARRRQLHQLAAETLETLYADNLAPHYGELAYHSEQAQDATRLRTYLYLAGIAAEEAYQNDAALDYFERLLPHIDATEQTNRYTDIQHRRGKILLMIGQLSKAEAAYAEALAQTDETDFDHRCKIEIDFGFLLRHRGNIMEARQRLKQFLQKNMRTTAPNLIARMQIELAHNHMTQSEFIPAKQYADAALQLSLQHGIKNHQADALHELGTGAWIQANFDLALTHGKDAYALYKETDNLAGQNKTTHMIGMSYLRQGEHDQAHDYFTQALELSLKTGCKIEIARAYMHLGNVAFQIEANETAQRYYLDAYAINQELGYIIGLAMCEGNLGWVYRRLNNLEMALTYTERAKDRFEQIGHRYGLALAWGELGRLHRYLGRFDAALAYHDTSLTLERETKNREGQGVQLLNIALCYQDMGSADEALAYFDRAIQTLSEIKARIGWCEALISKATLLISMGRYTDADNLNQMGIDMAKHINSTQMLFEGEINAARILHATGHPETAVVHLTQLFERDLSAENHADVQYTLWQLVGDEALRTHAIACYTQCIEQMSRPYHRHQQRLTILTTT